MSSESLWINAAKNYPKHLEWMVEQTWSSSEKRKEKISEIEEFLAK